MQAIVLTPRKALNVLTEEEDDGVATGNGYNPFLLNPRKRIFHVDRSCIEKPSEEKTNRHLLSLENWFTESRFEEMLGTCRMLFNWKEVGQE